MFNSTTKEGNYKKVLILSAPSGAGKTTIVEHLLSKFPQLGFSVSATSRPPRKHERHGVEYHFLTLQEFKKRANAGEFIEFEEVYPGLFYGTLKSDIERIWNEGRVALFDIDVQGGINLKSIFKEEALSIFIMPPSVETLRQRLVKRGTESQELIATRVAKAAEEIEERDKFDTILINDNLEICLKEAEEIVAKFIEQ